MLYSYDTKTEKFSTFPFLLSKSPSHLLCGVPDTRLLIVLGIGSLVIVDVNARTEEGSWSVQGYEQLESACA
jgi:hypothetical protein